MVYICLLYTSENGVLVPFFGYETLTADGPAVLGRMQDVPIILSLIHI